MDFMELANLLERMVPFPVSRNPYEGYVTSQSPHRKGVTVGLISAAAVVAHVGVEAYMSMCLRTKAERRDMLRQLLPCSYEHRKHIAEKGKYEESTIGNGSTLYFFSYPKYVPTQAHRVYKRKIRSRSRRGQTPH